MTEHSTAEANSDLTLKGLAEAFALHQSGRLDDAEAAYAKVLSSTPDDAVALINAGALALARNDVDRAIARLSRAVALVPNNAAALNNLGYALIRAQRDAEALAALDRALARNPNYAQAHNNRGIALLRLEDHRAAIVAFKRALALDPHLVDAAINLGEAYANAGDALAAADAFDSVLVEQPEHVPAHSGRAYAMALRGDLQGSRDALEKIVARHRDYAPSWQTLGAVANWSADHERAEAAFARALELAPDHAAAQFGIASTQLACGRYREGFEAFEHRPEGVRSRRTRLPQFVAWDGAPLDGTLLVYGEQGLGDVVQFARFIAGARARVGRIVLLLDQYWAPLAPLLATCAGVDRVATDLESLVDESIAARLSVLSLPCVLGIEVADLPGRIPYLNAPSRYAAQWRTQVSTLPSPRIGLAWSVLARDVHAFVTVQKSLPPSALTSLLATPDVSFVSVQPYPAGNPTVFGVNATRVADWGSRIKDFGDTAALINSLDLVVAADTAVAHVAGALGVPVWMLDRYNTCWRWRLNSESTPWYPTMTIFRQQRMGDWRDVVERVCARLNAWRIERSSVD